MSEFPSMPLWIDAFTADTTHMTATETGAYILLLVAMWRGGGVLPPDDRKLCRWAKLTPGQWRKIKPTMMEFFHVEAGWLTHNKLLKSLEAVRRRSQSARYSANCKPLKMKQMGHAFAERPQSDRSALAMLLKTKKNNKSLLMPTTAEPDTSNEVGEDTEPKAASGGAVSPDRAALEASGERLGKYLRGRH